MSAPPDDTSAAPTVAYQGLEGSFSSIASAELFGSDYRGHGTSRFRDIFEAVTLGNAQYGVVPVENALAGSVHEIFDLLVEYPVHIVREHYLSVALCLLMKRRRGATASTLLGALRQVFSHPKALEQCSRYFATRPEIILSVHSDTAGAARHVAERGDGTQGAIASREAGDRYGLTVVAENIQDHVQNFTRFVAIALRSDIAGEATKASYSFLLPHRPRSLQRALGVLGERGLNLTKIESRPVLGRPFEYRFHLDVECRDGGAPLLRDAEEMMETVTDDFRVLGRYPAAKLASQQG